jgi:ParB-like chromosome segregation protein Spo0J
MSGRPTKFVHVELVDIDSLTKAPYNPRRTDPYRYDLVKTSLKKLGWLLPMYVTHEGVVLSGHQRLDAAREMGAHERHAQA